MTEDRWRRVVGPGMVALALLGGAAGTGAVAIATAGAWWDPPPCDGGPAALVAATALFIFFRFSLVGKAIRACADNYLGAKVVGLNVKHLYALTFGLGSACVAIAGCALSVLLEVTPQLGPAMTLLAFVIVIIGGMGSMAGALLGGVLIGMSEALAGLFIVPSAKSMFSFGLLILVLLFRPQGLLGARA